MSMAKVAAILRTVDIVKKSDLLTAEQKAAMVSEAQREIDGLVGQQALPGIPQVPTTAKK